MSLLSVLIYSKHWRDSIVLLEVAIRLLAVDGLSFFKALLCASWDHFAGFSELYLFINHLVFIVLFKDLIRDFSILTLWTHLGAFEPRFYLFGPLVPEEIFFVFLVTRNYFSLSWASSRFLISLLRPCRFLNHYFFPNFFWVMFKSKHFFLLLSLNNLHFRIELSSSWLLLKYWRTDKFRGRFNNVFRDFK
jgi:hypothetical protein